MGTDFVEDWTIVSTLGEGAFGEVKLLVNKTNGDTVAMKMIDLEKHPQASENVQKEVCIHRMLIDPSVIRYYGQRKEDKREYIFLEYAAGGELFDRIEPDVGMPEALAQKYMKQLISGVDYLHKKGIAHRDLKPENLLLDVNDNLKITDFGMATIFRLRGKERLLETRCGTLPYVAPELLQGPYRAQPVDLWSCGIILIAMLTGAVGDILITQSYGTEVIIAIFISTFRMELPWDKPSIDCEEYLKFRQEKFPTITPWTKMDNLALSLTYSILKQNPDERATLEHIVKHRWMSHTFKITDKPQPLTGNSPKRRNYGPNEDDVDGKKLICQSQPEPRVSNDVGSHGVVIEKESFSFSQPTHIDDLLLSTQLHFTQSPNQNHYQKLVKRMTRFFVNMTWEAAVETLCNYLDKQGWKSSVNARIITVTTVDNRNMQLVFKAHVLDMDGKILIDFRLSKGCGLEFKRRFVKVKQELEDMIVKGAVENEWPVSIISSPERPEPESIIL